MQSIVIPESVKKIGDGAFSGCSALQSVVISKNVTVIGIWGYKLNLTCKSSHFKVADNILYSNDGKRLIFCWSTEKEIQIPKGVKEIGSGAFRCCRNLQSVVIPDSVTEIGKETFSGCSSLKEVKIPRNAKVARLCF